MGLRGLLRGSRELLRPLYVTAALACIGLVLGPEQPRPGPRPLYGVPVVKYPVKPDPCLKDGKPVPCSKSTFTGK